MNFNKTTKLPTMKNFLQLVSAAVLGGAITLGAFNYFSKDSVIIDQAESPKEYNTSYREPLSNNSNDNIYTNFVVAAEKANPAVVHITAKTSDFDEYASRRQRGQYDFWEDFFGGRRNNSPQAGTGSGVLITKDGYIVTNNHVVGFADVLQVTTQDGKVYDAKKIGTDPSTDIALIKIEGQSFPNLKFANSDKLKVGEWVVAVGNPFNLTSTVTAGIISAIGRNLNIIKGQKTIEEFIQTDAVVNPGNSGGALVNVEGDLIGINTAISSPTGVYAGYSFAIPSNLVKIVIDEIKESGGDIRRAMLGISIADLEEAKKELKNIKADYGVVVAGFVYDRYGRKLPSSAEAAGVEVGDVIVGVDGKMITNYENLTAALKFVKVGDIVNLEVDRNGKKKKIEVKLRQGI